MITLKQSLLLKPFPILVQRNVFDNTNELNDQLLKLIKKLIEEKNDVTHHTYITTEGAKQVDCNILLEYYGKESCITTLMDKIITPSVNNWLEVHFQELTGKSKPMGAQCHLISWATIYEPGSWQTPHIHRDKTFTGIYYLKMNESNFNNNIIDEQNQSIEMKAEGSLVIQNPHLQSSQPLLGGWQTHREILPVEGELIIFPSWISHFPKPFTKGERAVIVFDAQYLG